jgi:16S rRNA (guanine527-N7)-methyltransferase
MTSIRTNRIVDAADFAAVFGVSRETLARLEVYARLLAKWQKTINLVAPSTLDEVWHRHFADSAQVLGVAERAGCFGGFAAVAAPTQVAAPHPLPQFGAIAPGGQPLPLQQQRERHVSQSSVVSWVDLGSGAGFPGLVVGILLAPRGRMALRLVDSDQRKAAFLREVVRETGLKQLITVDIVADRIEVAANHSKDAMASVVSARALAPLPKLLDWAQPYFGPDTVGVFLKGREAGAEVAAAQGMAGWSLAMEPSVTEPEAQIVVARRLSP